MRAPEFLHLIGTKMWAHCDHEDTRVDEDTATVRLQTKAQAGNTSGTGPDAVTGETWIARRGGAALCRCRPSPSPCAAKVLADPGGRLRVLRKDGWVALPPVGTVPQTPPESGGLIFGPSATQAAEGPARRYRALDRDPFGRLWLLEAELPPEETPPETPAKTRIRLLAETDLRVLDTLEPPRGADLLDLAATRWGVVAVDQARNRIWRQVYGGEWQPVILDSKDVGADAPALAGYRPVACAGGDSDHAAVILWPTDQADQRNSRLAIVERHRARHERIAIVERDRAGHEQVEALETPLPLLLLSGEELLIGESSPEAQKLSRFTHFKLTEDKGLSYRGDWGVRGFDGRALYLDAEGRPQASTADGERPLFRQRRELVPQGVVETFALDSEIYGCVWHRLFLDVCLPPGTSLSVEARTADELWPETLMAQGRPHPLVQRQQDAAAQGSPEASDGWAWDRLPLGSRGRQDPEGWLPVGTLDRRPAHIDLPFPPRRCEDLPLSDPDGDAWLPRGPLPEPVPVETLEGLVKNPPGRYLWLRIQLSGTARKSPALAAVRATYPRPSLLEYLPEYWRAGPSADATDRALALFEGHYTEIDRRIEHLRRLFDPQVCPQEALDYLAGFVALSFDTRLLPHVRRRLLMEAMGLYRQRGTVDGLERLCTILGQCRAKIVERFRLRSLSPAFAGARDTGGAPSGMSGVLGPGLQLGRREALSDAPELEPWERKLEDRHKELVERRKGEDQPCPPGELDEPFDKTPLIAFYRRQAHRFSLFLFRERDPELEAVIKTALDAAKPAHTLHDICWLEAGFRLGTNSYVGIGTRLAGRERLAPALVGDSPLGMDRTIGLMHPADKLGTFVGASTLGQTSNLG